MLRIAVVDDEPIILKKIADKIKELSDGFEEECIIEKFTDGFELLARHSENAFDIIFLDIDMPGIFGTDIAKKLRERHAESEIVFVTNKDEMVYEAIKYMPFRFIRKTRFNDEIYEAIVQLVKKRSEKNALLVFSIDNGKKTVNVVDIIYIEVQSHKLYVHIQKNGIHFTAKGNLKDVEKELAYHGFIKIHQSYLVNYRYINAINRKSIILDNGESLPISRGKYESVQKSFMLLSRGT